MNIHFKQILNGIVQPDIFYTNTTRNHFPIPQVGQVVKKDGINYIVVNVFYDLDADICQVIRNPL